MIAKTVGYRVLTRWILPAAGIAIALVVLFWLYQDLDFERFLFAIASAELSWLFVLAGTILLEQFIRGWKWRQILFDLKPVSSVRLFGAILAGYGTAVIVPIGISPLVRSWLVARLEGLRWASVIATSAIERFLDGVVFALFAAIVVVFGQVPEVDANLRSGLMTAGALGFFLFSVLLFLVFAGRSALGREGSRISRLLDWLEVKGGSRFEGLRLSIRDGIIWPRERHRQFSAVLASIVMKVVASTHFLWAGLAVGIVLAPIDYVFLMVFAGFAMVIARFIRIPGGFVIGSGFALNVLGVPNEQALTMILINHILSVVLMVGVGLLYLWWSGIDIRKANETVQTD